MKKKFEWALLILPAMVILLVGVGFFFPSQLDSKEWALTPQDRVAVDRFMAGENVSITEFPWWYRPLDAMQPSWRARLKNYYYFGAITEEEYEAFAEAEEHIFLRRSRGSAEEK